MTTTPNLHLPQWEASDRIMMDDFNDAMQSIDAACAAATAKSALTLIKEVTPDLSGANVSLDLSDIDWDKWQFVIVNFQLPTFSATDIRLFLNGGGSHYEMGSSNSSDYFGKLNTGTSAAHNDYPGCVIFLPLHDKMSYVRAAIVGARGLQFGENMVTYSAAQRLTVLPVGDSPRVGSKFTVYGI